MTKLQFLNAYLDALYLERGLSETTLRAYRVDLEGVSAYARSLNKTIEVLTDSDINGFIGSLFSEGLKITSIQRKLSALHGFYKYQIRHGCRDDDPMAQIHRPAKGRPLPKTLSESDVSKKTCFPVSSLKLMIAWAWVAFTDVS